MFSVSSGMGLIVGFALFGSITYLSLYLQDVLALADRGRLTDAAADARAVADLDRLGPDHHPHRSRPNLSDHRHCADGRRTRAAVAAGGAHASVAIASLYMFVLGLGLGCVIQVLVLAVQNAVDYKDLGVATSGATVFRSIGGTVGVAVLGSIFNRLVAELKSVFPAGSGAAAGPSGSSGLTKTAARTTPADAARRLPACVRERVIDDLRSRRRDRRCGVRARLDAARPDLA